MLNVIIQQRMSLGGVTQAKLSQLIGATPSQVGLFLKGEASLNNNALVKCLKVLDVNIEIYNSRYKKASAVADKLKNNNISIEQIANLSKNEMIKLTDMKELSFLIDVASQKVLDDMVASELIDVESTYPFFKAMVMHLYQIGEKSTPKSVDASYGNIAAAALVGASVIPIVGAALTITASLAYMALQKGSRLGGSLAPLYTLTEKLINKK